MTDVASPQANTALRCAWCGAPARPAGHRLIECRRCGAATTYPPPDDAELDASYGDWYRPDAGRFGGLGDEILRRSRGVLARRIDRRAPPGPVLDVGSGDGVLIDAVRASGREAVGLERHADRPGVRSCELAEFEERPGEWAAIVLWHSLEHLREPAAGIDRACALLAPGGLLIVAVPNRDSWQARFVGERWFALDLPRHLLHLTAAALTEGLRSRGLRIERISHWRGGQVLFGWLDGLVAMLPGHPDLYASIRSASAREAPIGPRRRAAALVAGACLLPVAVVLAGAEVLAGAGGTVCVEARRA